MSATMAKLGLEFYSSRVREIEGECLFLNISGDFLVAGSSSGQVACWSLSRGSEIWRREFDGPCSNSDTSGPVLFFTESNKVHSIDLQSGEVLWAVQLEGSSDFVRCSKDYLWVTSSVYNFEIQDYSEGEIWKLGLDGRVIRSWKIEGRAWAISTVDDIPLFGLSRPNCGLATVTELEEVEYVSLENDFPVTVGKEEEGTSVILGHSNGNITEVSERGSSSLEIGDSAVTAVEACGGWIVGLESGELFVGEEFGSWSTNMEDRIETISIGPSLYDSQGIWASSRGAGVNLVLLESSNGEVELDFSHPARIISVFNYGSVICFGDSDGQIFILEEEVLRLRFGRSRQEYSEDEDMSMMRRKIRGLRKG